MNWVVLEILEEVGIAPGIRILYKEEKLVELLPFAAYLVLREV